MKHCLGLIAALVLVALPVTQNIRADDCPEYFVYVIPPGETVSTTLHCCKRVPAFPKWDCDLVAEPCDNESDTGCPTYKRYYFEPADAQCLGWTEEGGFECVDTSIVVLDSLLVGCHDRPGGCDCAYNTDLATVPTTLPQPCGP